jgi:MOSC domain-containing protein YiiM
MYDADVESLRISLDGPLTRPRQGRIESLSASFTHTFAKAPCESLTLLEGLGVEGDAHCGALDQHLFLGKPNPPPNLRQLHLFPSELVEALAAQGFHLAPGAIGENLVCRGVDLLALPLDAELVFPSGAAARLTGRRTPCRLVDRLGKGLMKALGGDGAWGERPIAGVMAVIAVGGQVRRGDEFFVRLPPKPHRPLPGL